MSSRHSIFHDCTVAECGETISFSPDEQFVFEDDGWRDVMDAEGETLPVCGKHTPGELEALDLTVQE